MTYSHFGHGKQSQDQMARINTIDRYFSPIKQDDTVSHAHNELTIKQDKVSYTECYPAVPSSNLFLSRVVRLYSDCLQRSGI